MRCNYKAIEGGALVARPNRRRRCPARAQGTRSRERSRPPGLQAFLNHLALFACNRAMMSQMRAPRPPMVGRGSQALGEAAVVDEESSWCDARESTSPGAHAPQPCRARARRAARSGTRTKIAQAAWSGRRLSTGSGVSTLSCSGFFWAASMIVTARWVARCRTRQASDLFDGRCVADRPMRCSGFPSRNALAAPPDERGARRACGRRARSRSGLRRSPSRPSSGCGVYPRSEDNNSGVGDGNCPAACGACARATCGAYRRCAASVGRRGALRRAARRLGDAWNGTRRLRSDVTPNAFSGERKGRGSAVPSRAPGCASSNRRPTEGRQSVAGASRSSSLNPPG